MGLANASPTRPAASLDRWLLPGLLAVIAVIIAMGGDAAREALKYDRPAIEAGAWWRLLSGHMAHLGASHLVLNIAGLVLVWMLVGARATLLAWSLVLLWTVLVIDLGFWIFDSNMLWYVGLSGVLHGLLVAGAIAGLASNRGESLAILVLIFTKVAFEQIVGPLPGSETTSGGPVVVNAHLYGAIAGLPAGVALWLAGRISAA